MSENTDNTELDAIAAEAAAVEAAAGVALEQQPGAPVAPVADPSQEWRDAVHMGCGLVIAMRPELREEWAPDKLDNLGNALAKCAEHYGWQLGALLGHPLVALAFAAFPLGASLVRIERERAEKKAAKPRENTEPSPLVVRQEITGNLEPAT